MCATPPPARQRERCASLLRDSPYGICLGTTHLTNSRELTGGAVREDRRHLTRVRLRGAAQRTGSSCSASPPASLGGYFCAANAVYRRCRGGTPSVAMVIGHGILGFRDPTAYGAGDRQARHQEGHGMDAGSESVALGHAGLRHVARRRSGEAVFIDEQGRFYPKPPWRVTATRRASSNTSISARPDLIIDNISSTRRDLRMGERWRRRSSASSGP